MWGDSGTGEMRPRYTKKDKNQSAIINDLRKAGCYIWDLSDVGGEVLDLMVFWRGMAVPVEIKQPGLDNDLTESEREGMRKLIRVAAFPLIATKAEDVLSYISERTNRQDE